MRKIPQQLTTRRCPVEQRLRWARLTLSPQRRHGYLLTERSHARRDQIPSPTPAGEAGPSNRWLARVLAGRLGPTQDLLCRDGIESEKLKTGMLTTDHQHAESAR